MGYASNHGIAWGGSESLLMVELMDRVQTGGIR